MGSTGEEPDIRHVRQTAFQRLRPPCVNLSATALKFKTNQIPVKELLQALNEVHAVLVELSKTNNLDAKLAEYAFFPLAQQVFNESKRLSSRCLSIAVDCVTLLVNHGYGIALQPELGKQLLILMSMLAGGAPQPDKKADVVDEELKASCFSCVSAVLRVLDEAAPGKSVFENDASKNIFDQLTYILLETVAESSIEDTQFAASNALNQITASIQSRIFLASLLPRTVSCLVKALRPNVRTKRSSKVLASYLQVLELSIVKCLADDVALLENVKDKQEAETLDRSWLNASATQIKNGLIQVCKLRSSDSLTIRQGLEHMCASIIETCRRTLADSVPVLCEVLVVLASHKDDEKARTTCRYLITAYPEIGQVLRDSILKWSESMHRTALSSDELKKQELFRKLSTGTGLLQEADINFVFDEQYLAAMLISSTEAMMAEKTEKIVDEQDEFVDFSTALTTRSTNGDDLATFKPCLLNSDAQRATTSELQSFLRTLNQSQSSSKIIAHLIDTIAGSQTQIHTRIAALYLATFMLQPSVGGASDLFDMLTDDQDHGALTRHRQLSDLIAFTLPHLEISPNIPTIRPKLDVQLRALSIEALVLHASTFSKQNYRSELIITLYPLLTHLSSPSRLLKSHAITALHCLTQYCGYVSISDLLISNSDYLTNSLSWSLNIQSLTPEAPRILSLLVQLCGARIVPYMDDVIGSVFTAIDAYHEEPQWTEELFAALKSIVSVSIAEPKLAIMEGSGKPDKPLPVHKKRSAMPSTTNDILGDLRERQKRKQNIFNPDPDDVRMPAPRRPWSSALDGLKNGDKTADNSESLEDVDFDEDDQNPDLPPMKPKDDEENPTKSKTHALLLSIATSTAPHLSSPSPRVRHLLLDLLRDISPLLSRDENSFLPTINAIWPVIVPRLFASDGLDDHVNTSREDNGNRVEETAYNTIAAADTISVLVETAGDFMASRIEKISMQIRQMFKRLEKEIGVGESNSEIKKLMNSSTESLSDKKKLRGGVVDLQIVKPPSGSGKIDDLRNGPGIDDSALAMSVVSTTRTQKPARSSNVLILAALVRMLTSILSHTSLVPDTGDAILELLLPYIRHGNLEDGMEIVSEGNIGNTGIDQMKVREACELWNADAVWLEEYKHEKDLSRGRNS